ncbi:flexible cuticle protein 12-like [Manduca sexta]|uniref:flexible cuticle protein 12 n=1 Tax=Manduca sexta TaxID=7130 RepID=UPI00188FB831|nr:flexible cuticle protein 12 [Manduca sexta]XP_037302481.1 flexible cuticle protein 12-like [Manduca sexta]
MRYLIVLAVASLAAGARLDQDIYLPPGAHSAGGSVGLQAPHAAPHAAQHDAVQILRYENEINEQGYHYAYETSDGTKAEQNGQVIPGAQPEEGSLKVAGSYSYVGQDGQTYSVTYTADDGGFHADGAHLPTAPPIPEEILKSLQLTDTKHDQYSSQKSSYDADAGY